MADQAPVQLEPYATLRAEIDAGEKVSDVIEREKISPETWASAQAFWLKLMADEAERARFETTNRYQTLYLAKKKIFEQTRKRQKAKAEAPPIVEPPVKPLAMAEEQLAAKPTSVVADVALAPPPAVPKPAPAPPIAPPAMAAYAAPQPVPLPPPPVSALPMPSAAVASPAAAAPMPPPIVTPPPMVPRLGDQTLPLPSQEGGAGRTMAVDIHELIAKMKQATPFAADTLVPQEPRAAPTTTEATPFRNPAGATQPAPAVAPIHATSPLPPAPGPSTAPPPTAKTELGSTMIGIDAEQLLRKAFPFAAAAGQPVSATQPDVRPPTMPPATPFEGARREGDLGATSGTDLKPPMLDHPGRSASPLPFKQANRSPDAAANKIFNINQFASLTAEIAEQPANAAEIRKRYGVTEAQHRAESERWTQEFAANAELRDRYFGSVQRYREYLKNRSG